METARLEVIDLPGRPYERGRLHGRRLAGRIGELLQRWRRSLADDYGVDPAVYLRRFRAETAYEATVAATAPRILDELHGIADGSGASYEELFAFQHINEEFELAPRFGAGGASGEACSTVALGPAPGRPTLIAQNLDLSQFMDGFQVLFRYPCDESAGEILALSVPGMISLNGMNSHGLAVCDNALTDLKSSPNGVPVFALYRLLLECPDLARAIDLASGLAPAAGLNWVMGDPGGVAMIERSAGRLERYGPSDAARPIFHTNHPIVCADLREDLAGAGGRAAPSRSSHLRFAALQARLLPERVEIDVGYLKALLASRDDPDYPISRCGGRNEADRQIGFTLASSVFELHAGRPLWRLAAGPPHQAEFLTFGFKPPGEAKDQPGVRR
jgi:hypothetical protein